jgi:NAD(P)-dependent dehydrogenase (short-subunit alcohol dehydrogenase family)
LNRQNGLFKKEDVMGFDVGGRTALVTGANRGIGKAIVEALLERGAARVWAGTRQPTALADLRASHPGRLETLALDVTREEDVRRAAESAGDVALLVNNAGVAAHLGTPVTDETWLRAGRQELDVNLFGSFAMSQAFAPVLARNGGGAIVNIISVAGLVNFPLLLSYSISKAALHSLTQALRLSLKGQGTQVFAVYPGPVDTDMAARVPFKKTPASEVGRAILDGLAAGAEDIFPDPMARQFGEAFLKSPKALEQQVGAMAA